MTEDERVFPEEIKMMGMGAIMAVRRGFDRNGVMRYRIIRQSGEPVTLSRVQYRHNEAGLVVNTPQGPVAFDFKMEGE